MDKLETTNTGQPKIIKCLLEPLHNWAKLPILNQLTFKFQFENCPENIRKDSLSTPKDAIDDICNIVKLIFKDSFFRTTIIFDPFYSNGMVEQFYSLYFQNIIHKDIDFYEQVQKSILPIFQDIYTNPPYSGLHINIFLEFCILISYCYGIRFHILIPERSLLEKNSKHLLNGHFTFDPVKIFGTRKKYFQFLDWFKEFKFFTVCRQRTNYKYSNERGIEKDIHMKTQWLCGGYTQDQILIPNINESFIECLVYENGDFITHGNYRRKYIVNQYESDSKKRKF